jgi:hypothetical protein
MNDKKFCFSILKSDSYFVLNKNLIKILGLNATAFLSLLIDKDYYHTEIAKDLKEDGFFYETMENTEKDLTLNRYHQDICIEALTKQKIILTVVKGLPARRHFKILYENILSILKQDCGLFTNCAIPDSYHNNSKKSVCEGLTNKFAKGLQQIITNNNNKSPSSASHNGSDVPHPTHILHSEGISHLHPRKRILINRNTPIVTKEITCKKPLIRKSKRFLAPKKSDDVSDIIEYWGSKGFPIHRENTAAEAASIRHIYAVLDGTLFESFRDKGIIRKYKISEIKKAMDNFALAAFNKDYQPYGDSKRFLQKTPLSKFFYDITKGNESNKSKFLRYFWKRPILVSESSYLVMKDELPHITKVLANWYQKNFSDRRNGNSVQITNAFIIASKKLKQFMEENERKLRLEDFHLIYGCTDNLRCLAIQLTRTMDKELRENDVLWRDFHPGWLHTEKTFVERLPKFLKSERMMKQ